MSNGGEICGRITRVTRPLGILAYGSLIDDPGDELAAHIVDIIRGVRTPFPVEFSRKSRSRGDAPTLVPHESGTSVEAAILIVRCSLADATDMLWRRETRTEDRSLGYPGSRPDRPNAVRVETLSDQPRCDTLLYTSIAANIAPLTADHLAELAVASVTKAKPGLDGIAYLIAAQANGIVTALSPDYAAAILRLTGATDLGSARQRLLAGTGAGE
jgi:hypothetical protein